MICEDCDCKYDQNNLSRLQVLTDHVEFAEQQLKKGSIYTMGWADLKKWKADIIDLRNRLPECVVKGFDNERKKNKHRENCQCMLCQE